MLKCDKLCVGECRSGIALQHVEVFYLVKVWDLAEHGVIHLILKKLFFMLQYCNEIAVSGRSLRHR